MNPGDFVAIKFPAKAGAPAYVRTGVFVGPADFSGRELLRVVPNGGREIQVEPWRIEVNLGPATGDDLTAQRNREHAAKVVLAAARGAK